MSVADEIQTLYRHESRRILATLVRLLGDLDTAEEAMQEAFSAAAVQWPADGMPNNPRAWLVSTGRFKGIDAIRRRARTDVTAEELDPDRAVVDDEPDVVPDDQLRMVFFCCHPDLGPEARVALALREVCGLRTEEIARAFLASTEAIKKRIARAKTQLRERNIAYDIPSKGDLKTRLGPVLQAIYLVYNEGYAASAGDAHIRRELTHEALFLAGLVVELLPEPEALGLLSLLQFHESRAATRVDAAGDVVPLEEQDRSCWDGSLITEAHQSLQRAILSGRMGPYGVQAAIASVHAAAPSVEETRWDLIVEYYDMLLEIRPSPVVELQRAVGIAMRDGPRAGLELVATLIDGPLASYHSAHAVHADLARRAGDMAIAERAYDRAIELVGSEPERRYLRRQLEKIQKETSPCP